MDFFSEKKLLERKLEREKQKSETNLLKLRILAKKQDIANLKQKELDSLRKQIEDSKKIRGLTPEEKKLLKDKRAREESEHKRKKQLLGAIGESAKETFNFFGDFIGSLAPKEPSAPNKKE